MRCTAPIPHLFPHSNCFGDCPAGFLKHWKGRLGTYDAATCAFKDRTEECGAISPDDQGFCNILCKGDIYVGSYCMVDACSAMYQLIGIEVKWDERVSRSVAERIVCSNRHPLNLWMSSRTRQVHRSMAECQPGRLTNTMAQLLSVLAQAHSMGHAYRAWPGML